MRRHAGIGSRASRLAGVRQSSDASADRSNERIHATACRRRPTAAGASRRAAAGVDGHASRWTSSVRRRDPRAPERASRVREVHGSSESGLASQASDAVRHPSQWIDQLADAHTDAREPVRVREGHGIAANHEPVRLPDRSASPGPSVCRCRSPGEDWDFSREAA